LCPDSQARGGGEGRQRLPGDLPRARGCRIRRVDLDRGWRGADRGGGRGEPARERRIPEEPDRGALRRGGRPGVSALLDGTPKVQISLDLTNLDEALATARIAVAAGVDWLEAGTPLILAEGLHAVRALHR